MIGRNDKRSAFGNGDLMKRNESNRNESMQSGAPQAEAVG